MTDPPPWLPAVLLPSGLVVGSFLNVVVARVPHGRSVVRPASACPDCSTPLRHRDNIPVVSWLMLRGRCHACRRRISARYPLVELCAAALFVLCGIRFGVTSYLLVALVLVSAGTALVLIDVEHRRLPFGITGTAAAGVAVGLLVGTELGEGSEVGPVLGSATLWTLVYGGAWLATSGRGMGLGDVALAPVLGAALGGLGWGPSLVGLLAGFLIGSAAGIALIVSGRATRRSTLPHGPSMIVGAALGLFAGELLWRGYLTLFLVQEVR